jgi:hypothetical protein
MKKSFLFLAAIFISIYAALAQTESATEIIKMADEKLRGFCNESSTTMKIIRPTWQREVKFKGWGRGYDYNLTLIEAPAKEKGQSFLKRKKEMWSWNPAIARMIKLPPSMMSQGWMGSDYTNEDILKESSIVNDYNHKILGSDSVNGMDCYIIELIPKPNVAVIWGSMHKWVSKSGYLQMKTEFFDEDKVLIRTDHSYDVKTMDDREIPTRTEIIPADKEGYKTIIIVESIKYRVEIKEDYFSQQNLKNFK